MKWGKRFVVMLGIAAVTGSPAAGQNCEGWINRHPGDSPRVLGIEGMTYDSVRAECVLFDGNPDKNIRETWTWDGVAWTLRTKEGPDSLGGHALVYDSAHEITMLFGGLAVINGQVIVLEDTWVWDGESWQGVSGGPSARTSHAMAFDSIRNVVVLFGGFGSDSTELGDTWEWDGQEWMRRDVVGPSPRAEHCMCYDSERGVTVLHGGGSVGSSNETWEWDGTVWSERSEDGPSSRGSGLIYDSARRVSVLYGGGDDQAGQKMWEWDGQTWIKLNPVAKPPPIAYVPMAYDSARNSIVLLTPGQAPQTWEYVCEAPPCYPDLYGNGVLDLFDFLVFVNSFNAGDTGPADCDHNQSLDLFDFLCYTNAFNKGC